MGSKSSSKSSTSTSSTVNTKNIGLDGVDGVTLADSDNVQVQITDGRAFEVVQDVIDAASDNTRAVLDSILTDKALQEKAVENTQAVAAKALDIVDSVKKTESEKAFQTLAIVAGAGIAAYAAVNLKRAK